MKTIVVGNLKGGVGKTTSAVNLAYSFAVLQPESKILVVDLDPQVNATPFFSRTSHTGNTVKTILENPKMISRSIYRGKYRDLKVDIIKGDAHLTEGDARNPYQLEGALLQVEDVYEYCVIDTRPVFENLTLNALVAADLLLVPACLDKFCRDNLALVEDVLEEFAAGFEWRVFANKVDTRRKAQRSVYLDLVGKHDYPFMETCISSDAAINNALELYKPVMKHCSGSRAAHDYLDLAREVLEMEV